MSIERSSLPKSWHREILRYGLNRLGKTSPRRSASDVISQETSSLPGQKIQGESAGVDIGSIRVWQVSSSFTCGFLLVELKFFTFQDVSVDTSALSWARRDASQQVASVELIGNFLIELLSFGGASKLSLHVTRPLGISAELIRFFKFLFVKLNVEFFKVQ